MNGRSTYITNNGQPYIVPTQTYYNRNTPRLSMPIHRANGVISARQWTGNPINGASRLNNGEYNNLKKIKNGSNLTIFVTLLNGLPSYFHYRPNTFEW